MAEGTFVDSLTRNTACVHVVSWAMGYPPGDTERLQPGGWRYHAPSGIAFKHHQISQVAAAIAAHGLRVVADDDSIERWWGLSLTPDQWRIPPDEWCEQRGLTMPIETPTAEIDGDDLAACQAAYVGWIQTFWNNTTHRALVERLAEAMLVHERLAGTDIAAFLNEAAQTLGPGGVDAPE